MEEDVRKEKSFWFSQDPFRHEQPLRLSRYGHRDQEKLICVVWQAVYEALLVDSVWPRYAFKTRTEL